MGTGHTTDLKREGREKEREERQKDRNTSRKSHTKEFSESGKKERVMEEVHAREGGSDIGASN